MSKGGGKQTVGYRYYLGMHIVLCHGPIDNLIRISVDDKLLWSGLTIDSQITVDREDLFGGVDREGGISGSLDILSGSPTQQKNAYLVEKLGPLIPAFRGVTSVVLKHVYLGMNPYLKRWKFRATRIQKSTDGQAQWYPEKAAISNDIPSAVLEYGDSRWQYQILESQIFGFPPDEDWINGSAPFDNDIWPDDTHLWARINLPSIRELKSLTFVIRSNCRTNLYLNLSGIHIHIPIPTDSTSESTGDITFFTINVVQPGTELNIMIRSDGDTAVSSVTPGKYFDLRAVLQPVIAGNSEEVIGTGPVLADFDMNPAHIIRECLTDRNWGMGYLPQDIDDNSFTLAADTLYDERMGISLLWSRQIPIEEFISEIIRHIDAVLFVDKTSGRFTLKLIREDYNIDELIILNESNITKLSKYTRSSLSETVNSVSIGYWNQQSGKKAGITIDDLSLIQIDNQVINTTIQYPGFTNPIIAGVAGLRDLNALSKPILNIKIEANREASVLNIGDVFKFEWPENHEGYILIRVLQISFGDGKNNKIKITGSEDIFNTPISANLTVQSDETGYEDIVQTPLAVNKQIVFELPYLELVQTSRESQINNLLQESPRIGFFGMAAGRPSQNSVNATFHVNSASGFMEKGTLDFCPTAELNQNLDHTATQIETVNRTDFENVSAGDWCQIGEELLKFISISGNTLTVERGILDTVPTKHNLGDVLYVWDNYSIADDIEYAETEIIEGKLTPVSTGGTLPINEASSLTVVINSRAIRPYPPGNFQINGLYFPESVSYEQDLNLTWVHRDRSQQTDSDYDSFTAGNIGPEIGTTYSVIFYDQYGTCIDSYSEVTGTMLNFTTEDDRNTQEDDGSVWPLPLHGEIRIVLKSVRDGFDSYTKYNHTIRRTGYGLNYDYFYGGV